MTDRTFAERLRQVIDADPELTEAGLAVKAGLDNSAIRSLMSGRVKNPRFDTAIKICRALGTTVEDFMSGAFQGAPVSRSEGAERIRSRLSALKPHQLLLLADIADQLAGVLPEGQQEGPDDR